MPCMQHIDYSWKSCNFSEFFWEALILIFFWGEALFFFFRFFFRLTKKCEAGRLADYTPGDVILSILSILSIFLSILTVERRFLHSNNKISLSSLMELVVQLSRNANYWAAIRNHYCDSLHNVECHWCRWSGLEWLLVIYQLDGLSASLPAPWWHQWSSGGWWMASWPPGASLIQQQQRAIHVAVKYGLAWPVQPLFKRHRTDQWALLSFQCCHQGMVTITFSHVRTDSNGSALPSKVLGGRVTNAVGMIFRKIFVGTRACPIE